jgi:thioredoxin-related protein
MKNKLLYTSGIISLLIVVISFFSFSNNVLTGEEIQEECEIEWMSYEEATNLSKKKKKKIFVDVYTDWCGWCKKMDATTMKDPRIVAYMNKKFYAVKLNAESSKKTFYKGTPVTERELAIKIYKANSYPSTLYLDDEENLLINLPGYRGAEELDKILHFLGENNYKSQTWEQFVATYVVE